MLKLTSQKLAKISRSDVIYHLATAKESKEIQRFMSDNFRVSTPMKQLFKMTAEQYAPEIKTRTEHCVALPFSTLARRRDSGELVGVLLQGIWRRPAKVDDVINPSDDVTIPLPTCAFSSKSYTGEILIRELWKRVPGDINAVLTRLSCVRDDHQRVGIASKMAASNLNPKDLEKHGIDGFVSGSASKSNQTLLKKLGYEMLFEIPYHTLRDVNGKRVIDDVPGEYSLQLNFLRLPVKKAHEQIVD